MLLPLGYRQETGDWLVEMKKGRTPTEEFVTELTLADVAATEDHTLTTGQLTLAPDTCP